MFFLGGCDFHLYVIPTEANGKWRGFALILHFPISNECFYTAHKHRCLSWHCCFHGMDSVSFSTLHVSIIHRNTEYRTLLWHHSKWGSPIFRTVAVFYETFLCFCFFCICSFNVCEPSNIWTHWATPLNSLISV